MSKFNEFTGYVIAGGKSSRMGTDKAFLQFGNKTFLEHAVDILRPACTKIKLILNRSQTVDLEKLPKEVSYLFDIYEERGALGGVHAALADCDTEFAVCLAVDLPFVSSEAIKTLCRTGLAENSYSAFVPRQKDGRRQPVCAVYRAADCLPKAEKILSESRSASMRDLLGVLETFEVEDLSDNEDMFLNVNSRKDLELLRQKKG